MPRLSSLFTRRSALLTGFLDARQQELGKAVVKKDRSSEKFVPYASLEAIWSGPRLREFVDLIRPGFDHHRVRFVKENLLRTLSILVYIGWPYWESFAVVFLHHRDSHGKLDRLDDRIPHYTSEALCAFLGDFHAERFLTERCTFCPIDLEEGKAIYFNGDWRLPFVAESEQIGAGGYGQVTKEVIAKRHFIASAAHGPVPNEVRLLRR